MALVAFYFPGLIPPSDSGSSHPRPVEAEGKYVGAVQRVHAEKLCQLPSCAYSVKTHEMNGYISDINAQFGCSQRTLREV